MQAALAIAAMLPAALIPAAFAAAGADGAWNDFATYWLSGKLILAGQSPYEVAAIARLAEAEDIHVMVGTGYSYPPPLAVIVVPLSALPFPAAATIFSVISVVAFGLSVAAWLQDPLVWRAGAWPSVVAAMAAGVYPPILGSTFVGQVNLLVFAALSIGVRRVLRGDRRSNVIGGAWIGLAGVVKVVPLALALPLALRRRSAAVAIGAGAGAAILAAILLAPHSLQGVERLRRLNEPDPYWTNQSINGYVSRLTLGNDRVDALLPGMNTTLVAGGLAGALVLATIALVVRPPAARRPSGAVLAAAIGLTLVAATAAAPKNSFWNHAPALIGAALLLSPMVHARARPRRQRSLLLAAWYGLAVTGMAVDGLSMLTPLGRAGAVVSGLPLWGLLALWAALALSMRRGAPCWSYHPPRTPPDSSYLPPGGAYPASAAGTRR